MLRFPSGADIRFSFTNESQLSSIAMKVLYRLLRVDEGTSAVEYAILLALIVSVCVVAVTELGNSSYHAIWDVVDALE